MSSKEFNEHLKKIGGWKVIKDAMDQFHNDNVFLDEHLEEWKELYPDKWVAVFKGELIGVDANLDGLFKIIEAKNIPQPYTEVIRFLSTKKITWILSCQSVAC
jgi:hypothetical protein